MEAGACDYLSKDKLRNRQEFESRIQQAILLHNSILIKKDNAEIIRNQHIMRASQEAQALRLDFAIQKFGDIGDKKDALLKAQSFEAGRKRGLKDAQLKWLAKWGSVSGTASLILYFCWNFIKGAWAAWRK